MLNNKQIAEKCLGGQIIAVSGNTVSFTKNGVEDTITIDPNGLDITSRVGQYIVSIGDYLYSNTTNTSNDDDNYLGSVIE